MTSIPTSKSMLEAVVISSDEAEMCNSTGMPSKPTSISALKLPAKSNSEM